MAAERNVKAKTVRAYAKRLSEHSLDRSLLAVRVDLETKWKLVTKFGNPGEPPSMALKRGIDELVKDVILTKEGLDALRAEREENYRKRMAVRAAAAARNKTVMGIVIFATFPIAWCLELCYNMKHKQP